MTGTQIAYYFLCKRKLWLFTNHIDQEQTSDIVALGKIISDSTYKRERHEINIDSIVLDFYDDKTNTIHEIKKSDKMEDSHIWQVKYYISVLLEKGVHCVKGQIDYPKLKQTVEVQLTETDIEELDVIKSNIKNILNMDKPPEVINKPFCKKCAYYDLCYI